MREILFRGKRVDNGEWVEGFYAIAIDYLSEKEISVIFPLDLTLYPHSEFSSYKEVFHETVGQYTGVKDDHGTKIFEGDVVKCSMIYETGCYPHTETEIAEVRYITDGFYPLYRAERKHLEVIGNIHDNPELLEA